MTKILDNSTKATLAADPTPQKSPRSSDYVYQGATIIAALLLILSATV